MGSGKTTFADILVERYGFEIVRFAGGLKAMLRALLTEAGATDELASFVIADPVAKEQPLPVLGGKSARQAMQTLGSEWGRECVDKDLWVRIAMAKAESLRFAGIPVVIDDMRFPNEAKAVADEGGKTVMVLRPDAQLTQAHQSEGQLDWWDFSDVLLNDGSVEDLTPKADDLIRRLTNGRLTPLAE